MKTNKEGFYFRRDAMHCVSSCIASLHALRLYRNVLRETLILRFAFATFAKWVNSQWVTH